jgi:hypothetical protein
MCHLTRNARTTPSAERVTRRQTTPDDYVIAKFSVLSTRAKARSTLVCAHCERMGGRKRDERGRAREGERERERAREREREREREYAVTCDEPDKLGEGVQRDELWMEN